MQFNSISVLTKKTHYSVEMSTFYKMNFSALLTENFYCGQQVPEPNTTRSQLVSALSDAMFVSPGVHSAGTFARRKNNTYFFHFSHQTKNGMYAEVPETVFVI